MKTEHLNAERQCKLAKLRDKAKEKPYHGGWDGTDDQPLGNDGQLMRPKSFK